MRRRRLLPTATTVLAVALAASLSGCDGGKGSGEPGAGPTSSRATTSSAPTRDDLEAMHDDLHEVGTLIDEAAKGAADYQALVRSEYDKNPTGIFRDAKVDRALVAQEALQQERNDAIVALGESPALDDPEIGAAYDDFRKAGEKMFTFQDGYNHSMTFLVRSLDVCPRIFHVDVKTDEFAGIPGYYASQWVEEHQRLAKPCVTLTNNLARSDNYRVAAYAENMQWVIRKREEAVSAQGSGLSPHRSFLRLKKANETFLKRNARLLDFSGELKRISAIDEYQALDDVFEQRLGGASASPSPS